MSLNKQMMIFIASMLLILLIGTFALNLNNTKNFLQDQLSSHAQDTATSLGLSLSSNADPDDISTMETMINAVFDRGYYSNITLTDMDDKVLYQKINPKEMEAVPSWFIHALNLQTPTAASVVQSGWMPIGTLSVTSHAGYAYIELWQAFINLLVWFSIAALAAILIVVSALKWMLKPLKEMEKQAQAIVKKEYLVQSKLPSTTEFKRVVNAMNVMVQKMKEVFERDAKTAEKLQKMAYQDSVTGLSNRRHFEMMVDSLLDPKEDTSPGIITLVRIAELKELNDRYGYLIGDQFMKNIADSLQIQLAYPNTLLARLNGTEIVAICPHVSHEKIKGSLQQFSQQIPEFLTQLGASDTPTHASIAYMDYHPGQTRAKLLSALDYAIQQADTGSGQPYYYSLEEDINSQTNTWRELIETAIQQSRFILFGQSSYHHNGKVNDKEVLIRLKDENGTLHSAGYFMPAVEQTGKLAEIDQLVVRLALEHLDHHRQAERLAINLTRTMTVNESLQHWLLEKLATNPQYKHKLAFEIAEPLIIGGSQSAWQFIHQLQANGAAIGIDHFGSHFANMRYLQDLKPDYVKLDTAFTKAIEQDEQTRSYVSSLCEMAVSLDIKVVAMAVENQAQIDAFNALGVTLYQGYHFGAPAPL
jgi:diguanylate cyclase (GGDEF)-like protein